MMKRNSVRFSGLLISPPLLLALLLIGLLVWGLQAPPVYAATINVDDGGVDSSTCGDPSAPCRTIPYALSRATTGDTVFVWGGTYTETFTLRAGIVISGAGATRTFIDGENMRGPMVSATGSAITPTTVLRGVTIRRGVATNGGGVSITNGASPLIEDCIVSENVATVVGGGLYVFKTAALTLRNTEVLSNTSHGRGGGMHYTYTDPSGPRLDLFECHFENNESTADNGGGLWIGGTVVMTETAFVNNRAATNGGGIYQGGTTARAELIGGRLEGNSAGVYHGGGLAADVVVLSGTQVIGNRAGQYGGGVWANDAQVTQAFFTNNRAGQRGGGLYADFSVVISGTSVISNTAPQQGGGVGALRDVDIVNSLFARNSAYAGAAIWMWGTSAAEAQLRHLTIVTPSVGSLYPTAAGIVVHGQTTATITNTIFSGYSYAIDAFGGGRAYEDYNLYYNMGIDYFTAYAGGVIYTGTHSLYDLDPHFIDPAADDYHIDGESAALDAGVAAGVTSDFDGDARPVGDPLDAPDIGADEFTGLTVMRPVSTTMTFGAARARVVFDSLPVGLETITITVVPGRFPTDRPADAVISRTIWITPSASAAFTASLALGYADNELHGLSEDALVRLYRWDGSTWRGYTGTADSVHNVVTATMVHDFSPWVIGTETAPTAARLRGARALPGFAGFMGLLGMGVGALMLRKRRQWRI